MPRAEPDLELLFVGVARRLPRRWNMLTMDRQKKTNGKKIFVNYSVIEMIMGYYNGVLEGESLFPPGPVDLLPP